MKTVATQNNSFIIHTIITFRPSIKFNVSQFGGNFSVEVRADIVNVIDLLNKKYFPQIKDFCNLQGRDYTDLIKISSCADWDAFKEQFGLETLMDYGHSGKWHFGDERNDLDAWELFIADNFGFGRNLHTVN
jgi:hypothetical protein